MSQQKVLSDLEVERSYINFDTEEFTKWFYGEEDKKKRFLENYILSDDRLNLQLETNYLSYKEQYEEAMKRSIIVYEKLKKLYNEMKGGEDRFTDLLESLRIISACINKEGSPITLHYGMFIFGLQHLANDEQKAEWLPQVLSYTTFGTYAQTELGHGTFVRGIETTAVYIAATKEFILNSPTLTSYKFWPGNLGKTSNHAIVMAQLYLNGKHYGVQPFIIRIRDQETHTSLKGILVGDIGNKIGFAAVNNGYLGFNNVRIPLKNILMRNAKVLEDGSFVKLNNPLLNYGVMLYTRVSIILDTALHLSKAATIA